MSLYIVLIIIYISLFCQRYYHYPAGYSRDEGNSVVKEHLRKNMKQNMFTMKRDANKLVAAARKKGDTNAKRHMFKPHFLGEDAWKGCCDYWETDGFKKMSVTNTENRSWLDFAHASGAMPFEQRRLVSYALYSLLCYCIHKCMMYV